MNLTFAGSGDAFGSGGRFHTCFVVDTATGRALIDCGASASHALARVAVDPRSVDIVLLTHLHGDHYAGLPFLLMDACYNRRRQRPLLIAGPAGTEARVFDTLACLFPGAPPKVRDKVAVEFVEWRDRTTTTVGEFEVTPIPVVHPSGATSYGLRVAAEDRTLAYSGDTEWTASLLDIARDADLFVCECYTFERTVPFHLTWRTLSERRRDLGARRIILTHMSEDMLARTGEIDVETASDGLMVQV